MDMLLCVDDFKEEAKKKSTQIVLGHFNSGAGSEKSIRDNTNAFQSWYLRPRVLRDVSNVDLSVEIFEKRINFPVGIAPTALHKIAHFEGECATAKAARDMNTIYIQSLFSTSSVEEVAEAAPTGQRWIQSQILKDKNVTNDLMRRASELGVDAVVITVDQPNSPVKIFDVKNGFKLPESFKYDNFPPQARPIRSESEQDFVSLLDASATWSDLRNLKKYANLKIIAKGILTDEMASEAVELGGVDGIIVSNHGGRQLDGGIPPIEALPEVVAAVAGRCEVFMDGGIRTGTDILKALALGAKAVFVGRPVLWGLICGGEHGARRVLEILKKELLIAMQLMGVSSIAELQSTKGLLVRRCQCYRVGSML